MALIPKEQIEQIRFQNNIVEVITGYLPQLKRRGTTYKCNCPFHQEKTPSFTVNEVRQIFHCFGCGAGGDVFRFVMDYEKVDFVSAVQMLADRAGIEIVYEGGFSDRKENKDVLLKLHREAASFFNRYLRERPDAEEARRYLADRNLPDDLIHDFQIGFAPNQWDSLLKGAQKKGYTVEQLEEAGLVVPTERNGQKGAYDRFRNRIMFPICDQMGRTIGFSGRVINPEEKAAKYVNSPETLLFHKNRVLFALDKARKSMVDSRQAIVVEGQIDAIRCHQAGLTNVVASQGTALTENHARLIKRYADEVVLVLDADTAGVKAALASSEVFIGAELSVRVASLPEKEDPDSLILSKGPEALKQHIDKAPSAIRFLINCLWAQENMGTEAGKVRVAQEAMKLINSSPSKMRRDSMAQELTLLGLNYNTISRELKRDRFNRKQAAPVRQKTSQTEKPIPPRPTPIPQEEAGLLELLVHHYDHVFPWVHQYLPADCLSHPLCRQLLDQLMLDEPDVLTESLQEYEEPMQQLISRIQVDLSRSLDTEKAADTLARDYIVIFWRRRLERELKQLAQNAQLSGEKRFQQSTRIKQDLFALEKGWESALPIIQNYCSDATTDFQP